MVVIGRLRPRPIPILGRNWFYLSTHRHIGRGRHRPIPTTTDSNSGSLSILSLPPKYWSWSISVSYDPNRFQFWIVIQSLSTCNILVVVVIDRLRPRSIPILGRNWSIMTTTDYDPVYNYKSITIQTDNDLEMILGRNRSSTSTTEISVVVVICRLRPRSITTWSNTGS